MFIKKQQKDISDIKKIIGDADYVIVGAGAGLTGVGGYNYIDEDIFARLYTPFLKKGYKTIWEGITDNWQITENNMLKYWAYWATHINNVLNLDQLDIYKDLYALIKDKEYFVITTNGDDQFFRGGYDKDRIFAMQGNYKFFQCRDKCTDDLYENRKMIDSMLSTFDADQLLIDKKTVPRCPHCGELLIPNLRIDDKFVETPHMVNHDKYVEFIEKAYGGKSVFLEFGVGFNTPVIIRFPFEQITQDMKDAVLVRFNLDDKLSSGLDKKKYVTIDTDMHKAIKELI